MSSLLNQIQNAERRRRRVLLLCAGIAAGIGVVLPFLLNDYWLFVLETIFGFILITLGLNLLVGYLGELAFASAGLVGIGAYGCGLVIVHFGAGTWAGVGAGILAGAIGGIVVGLLALRVTRYYLVIATLAFGEVFGWFYVNVPSITYGSGGFTVPELRLFGSPLAGASKYYFLFFLMLVGLIATKMLLNSRFGRAFIAIRDNRYAAQASGIGIHSIKVVAYVWSGALSGLAGAMTVYTTQFVDPQSYSMSQVLTHFAMVMVGGVGSFLGSLIGASLLASLPALLSGLPGLEDIIFSILLILIIVGLPHGLGGWVGDTFSSWKERRFRV